MAFRTVLNVIANEAVIVTGSVTATGRLIREIISYETIHNNMSHWLVHWVQQISRKVSLLDVTSSGAMGLVCLVRHYIALF